MPEGLKGPISQLQDQQNHLQRVLTNGRGCQLTYLTTNGQLVAACNSSRNSKINKTRTTFLCKQYNKASSDQSHMTRHRSSKTDAAQAMLQQPLQNKALTSTLDAAADASYQ